MFDAAMSVRRPLRDRVDWPGKSGLLFIISAKVQPVDQMSHRRPIVPLTISGHIQYTLPFIWSVSPDSVACRLASCRHAPKSYSFASPHWSIRMFYAFKSRCTIPRECRNSRPSRICFVYFRARFIWYGPNFFSTELMEPHGMYSRKISRSGPLGRAFCSALASSSYSPFSALLLPALLSRPAIVAKNRIE